MNQKTIAACLIFLFLASLTSPAMSASLEESGQPLLTGGRGTACTGYVCINEVIPNPNGADDANYPNGEWFELHNNGAVDVDLTGWKVTTSANKALAFNANTIVGYQSSNSSTWTISPGEYVVIARNGDSNFYMTNTGLSMTLVDNNNNQLHTATWGQVNSGTSYEQDPTSATANWVPTGGPSPGQVNTAGGPVVMVPGDVIISEVMANPWPSFDNETWPGGEWVEITNTGTSDIDLTGYSLVDAAGNTLEFNTTHLVGASTSMMLSPGQHRVVAVNGTSAYGVLNNGVETVTLNLPNGSPTHEASWSSTIQGFALEASASSSLWTYAAFPTPETANPASIDASPRQISDIQMTELLTNASNDGAAYPDGEWIELHNTGSSTVDLLGWSILDGLGNATVLDPGTMVFNTTQGATAIEPDGRRLVQFTSTTELWDAYNHLFLRDGSDQIVDTATYNTDYGEDISLVRSEDPTDGWTPAPWMTPGQPEPGSMPSSNKIIFSEILPDGVDADNQQWPLGEWLELLNYGSVDIDLSGWKLQAPSRTLTLHEYNMPLQSTPIVKAGEVVLIALNGTSSFYLKHTSADSIGLLDATGATVDTISWSSTVEGESLIAPNSTHAGVGPNGSEASGDWILSAWATPGEVNPTWPAYADSTALTVTEVLPYCNDDSILPTEDWVEVMNDGPTPLNISRWSILNADGERRFVRLDSLWSANETPVTMLETGERAVFLMDEWMLSGLGDTFDLLHPDGDSVQSVTWSVVTDCQTLMAGSELSGDWNHTLWPTPGDAEPNPASFATKDDLRFTRFMPASSSSISSDMEFVEISNHGEKLAVLNGWTLRTTTGSMSTYDASFVDMMIQPDSSVVLANDATALSVYEEGTLVDIETALDRAFYFPNSGAALQLLDGSGDEVDTLVYGNGPVSLAGWSGIALVEPVTNLDNLIYLRGSGCGDSPDTNTVADWHHRWSRLGGSTFCYENTLSSTGTITPVIGPENGLVDLLAWIDGATSTLEVHMYQLHEPHLVEAMIRAQERGVEVTVVLDYGDNWWTEYNMDTHQGMATTLLAAGVDVFWFGDTGENPYAYIHSKVAVRDNESVWIGSGNWKSSSHPEPGMPGNRDWGVIVEDAALASMVQQHLGYDEDGNKNHITPVSLSDAPDGWSMPATGAVVGSTSTGIATDYDATLMVCPDTCIDDLVTMLADADEEILLSLQYLDIDWSYGWGENPIVSALEDAAQRGVRLRLILNGAYLDEDIQSVVDTMNEEWNFTLGYDTAAIVMSGDSESVTKLHNKGAIVDGEHVLISSINWGDSALVRNREMGLLISSTEVADVFIASWWEDWNRTDAETDSDQDRLLDAWEMLHGFNRAQRSVVGDALSDESMLDPDEDGLTNYAEQLHGGDPRSNDTDGDCIPDGLEVAWAQTSTLDPSMEDISPRDALTLADADGDGQNDSEVLGCDLDGVVVIPDTNDDTTDPSTDDDDDGVVNGEDECPETPAGVATDSKGCSSAQRTALVEDSTESTSGESAQTFFMILMVMALVLSGGAYVVLRGMRSDSEATKDSLSEAAFADISAPVDDGWQQPVLDASGPAVTPEMLARVPGWTAEMVKQYMDQGWTMDQLATYYEEQVLQHAPSEQH